MCEQCDPDVRSDGWSLKPGYFFDRDFALNIDGGMGSPLARGGSCTGCPTASNLYDEVPPWKQGEQSRANKYGILFVANTGGCQLLPDLPMPASPSSNLNAALANPTSGTVVAVIARLTSAIAMIKSATKDNQGVEIVAAWYHANPATCTRVVDFCPASAAGGAGEACVHSDVCADTPAAHADAMAALFETSHHYGHSNARVKVMQALAILRNHIATPTSTTTVARADIEKDAIAHMLVPMYQGAIQAAHRMDTPATAAAGLADLAAYWTIIKDTVAFDADDKRPLEALASGTISFGTNNLCTVKALLHRNLPDGSKLQYTHDWVPCPGGGPILPCPGAFDTARATEVTDLNDLKAAVVNEPVHLTEADIGLFKDAPKYCVSAYNPTTYTSCGVTKMLLSPPSRIVTLNQGA